MSREYRDGKEAMLDNVVDRQRAGRVLFGMIVLGTIIIGIPFLFLSVWFAWISFAVSMVVVALLVPLVLPHIATYVIYTWGLVAEDPLSGNPVVYGSGWHFSYPWEQVSEQSNISLEERTKVKEGLTIASLDDEVKVKISFQWRPNLTLLAVFRRMDDSTIEKGFFEPIERFVSTLIGKMEASEARNSQSIISHLAYQAFKDADDGEAKSIISRFGPSMTENIEASKEEQEKVKRDMLEELRLFRENVKDLEKSFGIFVIQVNVSDVDFSDDVKKARGAMAEQAALQKVYYAIAGDEAAYKAMSAKEQADIRAEARTIAKNAEERIIRIVKA